MCTWLVLLISFGLFSSIFFELEVNALNFGLCRAVSLQSEILNVRAVTVKTWDEMHSVATKEFVPVYYVFKSLVIKMSKMSFPRSEGRPVMNDPQRAALSSIVLPVVQLPSEEWRVLLLQSLSASLHHIRWGSLA